MNIKRLDKDNFLDQIVRYGFFAEQFPSCFSSDAFADNLEYISESVLASKSQAKYGNKNSTAPSTLSIYKNDVSRRTLSLPNPEAFLRLCKYMQAHWDEIVVFAESKQSLSPIIFLKNYGGGGVEECINSESLRERMRVKSDFIEGIKRCIRLSLGYKYRMKVDITNCYNSIYTHSITWAACDKPIAKKYFLTKTPDSIKETYDVADCIDCFTRFMRNNETNGIIVGPYVSRIVSEIVLARIDKLLAQRGFVFKRFVDDYKFYFRTEYQAQESLPVIGKILNEYNLTLNASKTIIEKYPYEIVSQVQQTYEQALEKEGVFGVLNAAAQLHLAGEKGAYKYALKFIRNREIPTTDWVIIPSLINIMLIDPKYGKYVTEYLIRNIHSINIETLTRVLNNELESCLNNELQQETLLFIQLIRDLNLKVKSKNIEAILRSDNDFAIIIALDIWKNRKDSVIRTKHEARNINAAIRDLLHGLQGEVISGARWLLIYEAHIHRLIPNYSIDETTLSDFFKKLIENKVSFYKSIKENNI